MRVVPLVVVLACLAGAGRSSAQALPTEAVSVGGGRVVFGGEVYVTYGEDDPGWFNYTDYQFSALRNFRASISTEVRASRRVQFLAEVRLDHGEHLSAYALFVRIRPLPDRRFDIQVGRVPPTFGAFSRTAYAYDNVVIGQPLAYQYLLSLRTDAVPRNADDLLRMRGEGWLTGYPVGNRARGPGVPLFNSNRYDTGVQLHGVKGPLEWTGSITTGSLSDPRVADNNERPQLAGRVTWQAGPSVRLGASGSRAAWLDDSLNPSLPGGDTAGDYAQSAVGLDIEASAGPWLARSEYLIATWRLPAIAAPLIADPVGARALIVEGRYRVWPGASLAARADWLDFDELAGSSATLPWEAPIRRIESAFTLAILRNVRAKIAWQVNRRDGGGVRHDSLWAGQVVYWF